MIISLLIDCKQKKHCLKAGGECKGNCPTGEVTVPGLCVKGCQCCIPEGKLKAMEMSRMCDQSFHKFSIRMKRPISNNKIFQILWVLKEEMVMEALMVNINYFSFCCAIFIFVYKYFCINLIS